MSNSLWSGQVRYPAFRDLTPAGQTAHLWFRQLARALRTCRLYRPDSPAVRHIREQLLQPLIRGLEHHGVWSFRITPSEIFLLDEPVVRPAQRLEGDEGVGREAMLPLLFYRDGIHGLSFLPGIPARDLDALFDGLVATSAGIHTDDDLVTLMWQANTTHIVVDAVPAEQAIDRSLRRTTKDGDGGGRQGQSRDGSPAGSDFHADIGRISGMAPGVHRDTFDDWPLPLEAADVAEAYQQMLPAMDFARTRLSAEWLGECSTDWTLEAPGVLRQLAAMSPDAWTRAWLARSVANWLAAAIQRSSWLEAQQTLELLREFDPDGTVAQDELTAAISGLDAGTITERLDASETDDQARFFALTVSIGRPALDFACSVMARASTSRTRAAACTMLCYLCSDDPELLAPYVVDSRWYVARNTAFVLGQIGGERVERLLHLAAQHPDVRVRRQVVASLGGVPPQLRAPILLAQLGTRDLQLLAAALSMLTRNKHPEVANAILRQIEAPDFESRSEEHQRALFAALGEVADESAIPRLAQLLHKGGWFARRTVQRLAAARTLRRIGSPQAIAALESGLRARGEAVRTAAFDAIQAETTT